ncbi:MAG: protein kinase [Desulfomicrobium sp.]|nr:protein kinase [Pseudomonadota bacterium]MBV1714070.1 protein kinase [Desulfomicrobium sp.]MBU4571607.1 protein kinase [Pseudomonadota bacterium]MBU4595755.1 protein kinase [Pseudomonadota bacterium]MBV1721673.1 protein kinase [Desulfomicrobium sp.]
MSISKKQSGKYSAGDSFDGWVLEKSLGVGGNGDVWRASKLDQQPVALKMLRNINLETYERFKNEIASLEELGCVMGVIPLLEKFIPNDMAAGTPWFTMPIATTFAEYISGKKSEKIVEDFISLAKVVEALHKKGISHRDIKPANFLFYNDRLCLSDFGLVKYPKQAVLTKQKRDVGAKFTMAPEMRRKAHASDGLPADVYSLAKSLWIALTGEELGFDGQYNPASTIAISNYLPETYTTTLDRLLVECTETDPLLRPKISTVIARLEEWLGVARDFHTRNLAEWTELTQKLFPLGAPTRSTWLQIDSICSVLAEISKVKALNHMFYPTGGGNTIIGVSRAGEEGMIALHIDEKIAEILKPAKLTYESFGEDTSWSYFRLEAAPVEPSGVENAVDYKGISEGLTEIVSGVYAPYFCWSNNEFDGEPLPDSARPICRFLKGSFVFFSTRSVYNRDSGTYDARHDKMTEEEFRSYIERNSRLR